MKTNFYKHLNDKVERADLCNWRFVAACFAMALLTIGLIYLGELCQ